MGQPVFQKLYDGFLDSMLQTVNNVATEMSSTLTGPLSTAVTIYIVGYGILILRGSVNLDGVEFAVLTFKLGTVVTLVSQAGTYNEWVGKVIVTDIPEFVSSLTYGAKAKLPSDSVFEKAGIISEAIKKEFSYIDFSAQIYSYIMGCAIYVVAALLGAIIFALTLFANFGLALMAAIGPLFIAFALFEFSRGWFFSWLSQILNFAVLHLLVTVLAIFAIDFIGDILTETSPEKLTIAVVHMLAGMFVLIIFYFLLPSIAAALSGGAQASLGTLQRVAERELLNIRSSGSRNRPQSGRVARSN